ncbi:MAG: hypothetical protein ACYTEV_06775, partial [Planctomycetota bacterium]
PRSIITLRAVDQPALAVLQQLAVLSGDAFERARIEAWGGRVLLTTDAIAGRILAPAVYDVRDLVAAESRRAEVKAAEESGLADPADPVDAADASADASADAPADAPADADAEDPTAAADADAAPTIPVGPGERLLRVVLEHAAPELWLRFGGASARVTERDGVLLVTASATTHRLLRSVLASLRQADPRGLGVEAVLLRAPDGAWERLDRRYDPSEASFARRLMAEPGATVLWRSRGAVAVGRTLEISEPLESRTVRLRLEPQVAAEDGTLRIGVSLEWGEAGLRTTVPLDTVGGAVTLGVPGGGGGEGGDLVLVVLPRRY